MSATFGDAAPGRQFLKPRLDSGVYYITPKPHVRSLGTKDRQEAERLYDQAMGKELPTRGDVRCRDAFEGWISQGFGLSHNTVKLYRGVWDRYCQHVLGGLFVQQVKVEHILRIYNEARTGVTTADGKPVSEDRIAHIHVCLSSFFSDMTREPTRYRDSNPVAHVGAYGPQKEGRGAVGTDEVLTLEEVETLIEAAGEP